MKLIAFFFGVLLSMQFSFAQKIDPDSIIPTQRKNAFYFELGGRGYASINYECSFEQTNRFGFGFGWNDLETNLDSLEIIQKGVGDHEASPYLLFFSQYSRIIGKRRSKLEVGAGFLFTLLDMERWKVANNLYSNESYVCIYPIIGYRFESNNGLLFMFTFNPIIQIPQGYFWPIPGISLGYRF